MSEPQRPLKVFLCHASQDKPAVRELYQRLKKEDWIEPWLDEEKLTLGQHWTSAIEDALDAADAVVIFLSHNSVQKEGFVQRELNYAWEISLEKPRNVIFLIPFRLDNCEVPRYLRSRQWGDYFGEKKEETYDALLEALKLRHEQKINFEAEESARKEKVEKERIASEEKARREAEERARLEAEALARQKTAREIAIKPEGKDTEKKVEIKQLLPKAERSKPDKRVGSRQPNIPIIVIVALILVGTICAALFSPPLQGYLFSRTPEPKGTTSIPPAEIMIIPPVEIISIVGAGLLDAEVVTIKNAGDGPLNLSGWQLKDLDKNIFVFPNLTLNANGAVRIHTEPGTNNVIDLYWNASAPIWESGEEAQLLDAHGYVVNTYQVP